MTSWLRLLKTYKKKVSFDNDNMREMTLGDIQNVSLAILKDVHAFCVSYNIKYSLAYGTLIGAIRHKGFIPWDDDVDILIPRPDFERFCHEFKSSHGYELYVPEDSRSFLTYARICDNEHTLVKTNRPWSTKPTGVWIDVFPLDGLPSDKTEFLTLVGKLRNIQTKVDRLRTGRHLKLMDSMDMRNFVYCLIKRILYYRYDIHTLLHQHIQMIKGKKYEDADFCGQLCVMDYPEKEQNPKEDFDNYLLVPFCDSEFYVMNGYDNILKRYYGDYMELPPENKRIPPQQANYRFFWR